MTVITLHISIITNLGSDHQEESPTLNIMIKIFVSGLLPTKNTS